MLEKLNPLSEEKHSKLDRRYLIAGSVLAGVALMALGEADVLRFIHVIPSPDSRHADK